MQRVHSVTYKSVLVSYFLTKIKVRVKANDLVEDDFTTTDFYSNMKESTFENILGYLPNYTDVNPHPPYLSILGPMKKTVME